MYSTWDSTAPVPVLLAFVPSIKGSTSLVKQEWGLKLTGSLSIQSKIII